MTIKPFYNTVDFLYDLVIDNMPVVIRERSMANAFILGSFGTYGVVKGVQWLSKNVVDKVIPGFDDKYLSTLEKLCIVGMAAAPVLYAVIDPQGAREVMTMNPTYTSGMIGVYAGSIACAVQDLHKRSVSEKKLQ